VPPLLQRAVAGRESRTCSRPKRDIAPDPKWLQRKEKRSSILKMANNLVGQLKEMDLNTYHTKKALRKVNRRRKLA